MFRHLVNRMEESATPDATGGAVVTDLTTDDSQDPIIDTGTDDDTLGDDPEIIEIIAEADDMSSDAQDGGASAERWNSLLSVVRDHGASEALLDFSAKIGMFKTSTSSVALEAMSGSPEDKIRELLIGSLEDLKERAASAAAKVAERMDQILRKLKDTATSVKEKMVGTSEEKGFVAKHPYATAAAAVASLAAIVGVVSFATGRLSVGNFSRDSVAEMTKKFVSMCKGVVIPGTKVNATVTPADIPKLTYQPTRDPLGGALGKGPYFTEKVRMSNTWTGEKAMKIAAALDAAVEKLTTAVKGLGRACVVVFNDVKNPARPIQEMTEQVFSSARKGGSSKLPSAGLVYLRVGVAMGIWSAIINLIMRSIDSIVQYTEGKASRDLDETAAAES